MGLSMNGNKSLQPWFQNLRERLKSKGRKDGSDCPAIMYECQETINTQSLGFALSVLKDYEPCMVHIIWP